VPGAGDRPDVGAPGERLEVAAASRQRGAGRAGGGADPGLSDLRVPTALGPAPVLRWAAADAQDRVSAVCPAKLVRASGSSDAAAACARPTQPDGAEQRAVGDGCHARGVRARWLGASHGSEAESRVSGATVPASEPESLVEAFAASVRRLGRRLMIVLDQFEEYLLYHPEEDAFGREFPKAVVQSMIPLSFLIQPASCDRSRPPCADCAGPTPF
jgi:hypothetical protein